MAETPSGPFLDRVGFSMQILSRGRGQFNRQLSCLFRLVYLDQCHTPHNVNDITTSHDHTRSPAASMSLPAGPYLQCSLGLTQFMSGPCGGTMCGNVMVKSVSVFLAELTVFVV